MPAHSVYQRVLRPLLFRLDPEWVHNLALRACALGGRLPFVPRVTRAGLGFRHPALRQEIAGVSFDNPLGLAAGFDKNGVAIELLGTFGFGHVEIGSVSAHPSEGNPRPRLFRVPADKAIVVAYGVPNEGAERVANRLASSSCPVPLGVNLVKTNDCRRPATDEEVLSDYTEAFARLQPHASYINLNMSCPNSASDRDYFDDPGRIAALLDRLATLGPRVPVFLKLKPVREQAILREIVRLADKHPFIAGFGINLPAGKPPELRFDSPREQWAGLPGAVSGRPAEEFINNNLRMLRRVVGAKSRYCLMAAGGVFTAEDAYRKIRLGASLVQLYTAMVYEGPGVVKRILQGLVQLLERDGFQSVASAVGVDVSDEESSSRACA